MKLIPEIREAWRFSSVRFSVLMSAVGGYWATLDKTEQLGLLNSLHIAPAHIPIIMGVVGIVLRVTTFRKDGP